MRHLRPWRLAAVALTVGVLIGSSSGFAWSSQGADVPCVVIDTDWDIDDLMAIPAVVAQRNVAAIVVTEGVSEPRGGAAAVATLLARPNPQVSPQVVSGMSSQSSVADPSWLQDLRASQLTVNGLLSQPIQVMPSSAKARKVRSTVRELTRDCTSIELMIIGPFTSFVVYESAIADRISTIVMQGKPLRGDPTADPADLSFNCWYDKKSCTRAFPILKRHAAHWVDVPKGGPVPYSPSLDMVTSLKTTGLPGTTRRALLSDRSTWDPTQLPPASESYLWDQGAALFLLDSSGFVQVGGHWEASFTPQRFRDRWTRAVNGESTAQALNPDFRGGRD